MNLLSIYFALLFASSALSQRQNHQRWYYTGKFINKESAKGTFDGHHMHIFDLYNRSFDNNSEKNVILYCGGLVLSPRNPDSDVGLEAEVLAENEVYTQSIIRGVTPTKQSVIAYNTSVSIYDIFLSPNYPSALDMDFVDKSIMSAEIGLYDSIQGVFVERHWRNMSSGLIFAVTAISSANEDFCLEHKLMWTLDLFSKRSLLHHTWNNCSSFATNENAIRQDIAISKDGDFLFDEATGKIKLRMMTFNLWHNNPPSWVYVERKKRWDRYERRLRHFAEEIVRYDPDIVAIQEVRLDSTFFSPYGIDSGSQVDHLLKAIEFAQSEVGLQSSQYQFVFHPSMLMMDRSKLAYRNEEGLLILSKYPILDSDVLFLPRDMDSSTDDHQRMALIARVQVASQNLLVLTSHFSLKSESRDIAVERILSHLNADDQRSSVQFIMGDFNAEPHEPAMMRLVDQDTGFVDSWSALHPEETDQASFTFPACNPIKRIDYIMFRDTSSTGVARLESCDIGATEPTAETLHLVGSREDLGMLDSDSPIWASDHYAVIVDVSLSP